MAQASSEERFKNIEHEIDRLHAVQAIKNVMGRYMNRHLHGPGLIGTSWELFALKTPGVLVEIADRGVWRGPEQVKACYERDHGDQTKPRPGSIIEHDLTTDMIEVAKDGQTAKAVWFSPGFINMTLGEPGEMRAYWRWLKIGAAFCKEDGEWKLWKYHVYSTFFADFYKSWVDYKPTGLMGYKPEITHTTPPTYDNPYRTDGVREEMPLAPEPYDTWDKPIDWVP